MQIKDDAGKTYECSLEDDGTLDTVIMVDGEAHRFDSEYASHYRNDDGEMLWEGFKALCQECIADLGEMLDEGESVGPIKSIGNNGEIII